MSEDLPARHGAQWDEDDYLALAVLTRAGATVEAVAHQLGRRPSALLGRLRAMAVFAGLEAEPPLRAPEALFAQIAQDKHFDVLALAVDEHAARRAPLWTAAMDTRLQRAWAEERPMLDELAAEVELTPSRTLDRLIRTRIAHDVAEVEQRLGLNPNGDIAARRRLGAEKTSVQLWALILTGGTGSVLHFSLHAQSEGAQAFLEELRPPPDSEPLDGPVAWSILPSVVGELADRAGHIGIFYPEPVTATEPEPEPAAVVDDQSSTRARRARKPRAPRKPRQPRGLADSGASDPRPWPGSRVEEDY